MADEAPPLPSPLPNAAGWPLALRQGGLLVGLAVAVAAGVSLVLWSQQPNYVVISAGLAERDTSNIMTTLEGAGITNKLDNSGQVLVPRTDLANARAVLADAGLLAGGGYGCFELPEAPMGQSPGMENVLLTRCLETELARTITAIRGVTAARVHLALPPRSVFVRDRATASASVHVSVAPGSVLRSEIASIPHLLADAVPGLAPNRVTVVDQNGVMLTSPEGLGNGSGLSNAQFAFRQQVEADLANDVVAILSPIVGLESVQAKVAAEIDFTVTTQESTDYDPNGSVLKAQLQSSSESRGTRNTPQGVPGALSNQPPETVDPAAAQAAAPVAPEIVNQSTSQDTDNQYANSSTRTIRQLPTGTIQSLRVAVLLDSNKAPAGADGAAAEYTPAQLEQFAALARQAVGFNAERGDTFQLESLPFQALPTPEPPPEPGLLEQAWIWAAVRQGVGALLVLVLAFVVVRPIMRSLTKPPAQDPMLFGAGGPGQLGMPGASGALPAGVEIPASYEERMAAARGLVGQDPRQVAQVVRNWVAEDDA